MARHDALSSGDQTLIRTKRCAINRLGFAIRTCLSRYSGQDMGPGEHSLPGNEAFTADQLGLSPTNFGDDAGREHTVDLVPGEGFEPPTFGLQNRCTAAVLTRPTIDSASLFVHLMAERERKN